MVEATIVEAAVVEAAIWDGIPIHPIVSFFGFFTLTSIASNWRSYYGQNLYQLIIGGNICLSLLFFFAIIAHNVKAIAQTTSLTGNVPFTLFSFAWALVILPIIFFWLAIRKM